MITPDLPCFGQSGLIPVPAFSRFTDLVEGLLEAWHDQCLFIYGHDFGGLVALDLAMRD